MGTRKSKQIRKRSACFITVILFAAAAAAFYLGVDSGIEAKSSASKIPPATESSVSKTVKKTEVSAEETAHWVTDSTGWRYQKADGSYLAAVWQNIEGVDYYFNASGYMANGWAEDAGSFYYFSPAGIYQTGWFTDTDGGRYHLSKTGAADTGWFTDTDGKTYHLGKDGREEKGWIKEDGRRFYLQDDGTKATGWLTLGKTTYYLGDDGAMKTGWVDADGKKFYLNSDGALQTGLQTVGDNVYYFGDDGHMTTGWVVLNGSHYYFDEDGTRHTGWLKSEGNSYYLNTEGVMRVGWLNIDGKSCYFTSDGVYEPDAVMNVTNSGKMIALTFDDGPGVYTDRLLDILKKNNAKATFFMIGEQVSSFGTQIRREKAMGMEIGNHSWDHATLTKLDAAGIQNELNSTNAALKAILGDGASLVRPPGGGYNDFVKANSCGYPLILWSIDTLDWKTKNAQMTYDAVIGKVRDGDIVLMHEIYSQSVDAAEKIIPELIKEGYQLVTVSELAQAKGVTLEAGKAYGRIG